MTDFNTNLKKLYDYEEKFTIPPAGHPADSGECIHRHG
jgi:hypothetical protein